MDIQRALPHPELRTIIRSFEERRADLGSSALSWPVAARPHQILNVHLGEPYRVGLDGGTPKTSPDIGLVGPQTYQRAWVHLSGRVHVFNVLLQPTGLNRLVGLDMTSLVNEDPAASDVLGKSAIVLGDAVRAAPDFRSRVAAAERWIGAKLDARRSEDAIDRAARRLLTARGGIRIDDLVQMSGFSASQFQRRFATQAGLSPKLFARTIRFDRALTARRHSPGRPWTDIIHEHGYFDQAHFVRECRAFAGLAPSGLVGDWDNVFSPADD